MARRSLNLHDAAEKVLMHCIAGLLHGRVKMSDMSDLLGPIGAQVVPLKQQDPEKALKKVLAMASRRQEACFLAELVDGNGLAGHTVCLTSAAELSLTRRRRTRSPLPHRTSTAAPGPTRSALA